MTATMRHYRASSIFGIGYRFENRGEGLRMHVHALPEAHNVVVTRGSVLVYGPFGSRVLKARAGEIIDIEWDRPHEIVALEPDTRLLNLFLSGEPAEYAALADADRSGAFELPLTHTLEGPEGMTPTVKPEWVEAFAARGWSA